MRTRVIPAQITTVEDRIAGSLNLTQLLLLMAPVFWGTIEFIILPPKFHVSLLKILVAIVVAGICVTLSLRIKGKVVLTWVTILLRYNLRPRWYVLNKNDVYLRDMHMPLFEKRKFKLFTKRKTVKQLTSLVPVASFADMLRLEQLITDARYTLSLKTNKKGGLNVGIEQIK